MAAAVPLLKALRQDSRERATWLIDITTDIGIPCLTAVSCDGRGRDVACGFAARLSPAAAARGAILEMCQMELALPIVAAKRRERGDLGLNDTDRRHLARALAIDAARCELLHPVGVPRRDSGQAHADADAELDTLRTAFARRGIEAALIDLTRPELAIPVVRAVAPHLQLMPCGMHVERLRRAISTAGGGERWTLGIPIH
jgi:ribosomal protein S12 methylthiotransferase accessory factor